MIPRLPAGTRMCATDCQRREAQAGSGQSDGLRQPLERGPGGADHVRQDQHSQTACGQQEPRRRPGHEGAAQKEDHHESEEPHEHGGDAGEQVDAGGEDAPRPAAGVLGQVDAAGNPQGNGDDGGQTHKQHGADTGRPDPFPDQGPAEKRRERRGIAEQQSGPQGRAAAANKKDDHRHDRPPSRRRPRPTPAPGAVRERNRLIASAAGRSARSPRFTAAAVSIRINPDAKTES